MSKTILVTGASRGIGRATALLCGARGWNVGINYASNAAAADETVTAVQAAGGRGLAIKGDVASETDVIAMFDRTETAFGPIDGVVNNAGIIAPRLAFAEHDAARWRRMIDVNVLGALFVARETARRLAVSRGGKGGTLVNLSSVAARLGGPGEFVDYAATKGAIDALTLGLGRELAGDGVRVNAVRPGLIDTDIHTDGGWPARARELGTTVPQGREGSTDEVAEAILWLLSDASSYVAGATIDVSGGR